MKTKIKPLGYKINNEEEKRKVPRKDTPYKCLSLIVLDSVIKTKQRREYYPQILLEEFKYKLSKNKVVNLISEGFD